MTAVFRKMKGAEREKKSEERGRNRRGVKSECDIPWQEVSEMELRGCKGLMPQGVGSSVK